MARFRGVGVRARRMKWAGRAFGGGMRVTPEEAALGRAHNATSDLPMS